MGVDRLGSWRVLAELGRGAMGAVYLATHTASGKRAAIKILLSESADPERLARFFQEATAAARIPTMEAVVEAIDALGA
jgi:eukaryotic-like serine/threonine-protein kinase